MRAAHLAVPLLLIGLASRLAAQRGGRSGDTGPRGAPASAPDVRFALAPVQKVREHANVADLLVEKARKLKLDPATVDSLKRLASAINERNAPHLAVYDSTRTHMRAAQAAGGVAGGAAGPGGPGGPPGRGGPMGAVLRALTSGRDADIPVVLALVPAAAQDEAKKVIEKQTEDLREAMSPRGPGGAGAGGRPPRP